MSERKTATVTLVNETARILVVDDDPAMRLLLRQLLEQDGHVVEEVEDGETSLAMFERSTPDVVLLDANMPGMDGFTVCAQLQKRFTTKNVPIVMVTDRTDESSITRAFDAGATDYTAKPINPVLLRHRLQRTIAAYRHRARVDYLAYYDPVTGLPNRVLFLDRFQHVFARAHRTQEPVGLLYLDVDRFKPVNDTLGHGAGDQLLREIGDRMAHLARSCDTVARLGGDEFVVLLTAGVSEAGMKIVAQKVVTLVSAPFSLAEGPVSVTASVGGALYPRDGDSVRTLLKNADAAMYAAKQSGGNTYRLCVPSRSTPVDMSCPAP